MAEGGLISPGVDTGTLTTILREMTAISAKNTTFDTTILDMASDIKSLRLELTTMHQPPDHGPKA